MISNSKTLQLEVTNRCTIACPACPRTIYQDMLVINDVAIDAVVRACNGFDRVFMCGNEGDPIYHPQFKELLAAIRTAHPHISFNWHTNGSFRTKQWWEELMTVLDERDHIVFSIDGMPHNNHMYRVNSKWSFIKDAIDAVVSSDKKVRTTWKWILFDYNQSDIFDGIALAKELGINLFNLNVSNRTAPGAVHLTSELDDLLKRLLEIYPGMDYFNPEKPSDPNFTDPVDPQCVKMPMDPYIDAHGRYFPCCFGGNIGKLDQWMEWLGDDRDVWNINNHDLQYIMNHSSVHRLKDSWKTGSFELCASLCAPSFKKTPTFHNEWRIWFH